MGSRTFVAVAIVGLLAASGAMAAGGKKAKQSGSVKGDSKAEVRLVLVTSGGDPKSVRNVRFKDLRTTCSTGKERIELELSGAAKVGDDRRFKNAYKAGKSKVKLSGRVKKDGSGVRGSIEGTTVKASGAGRCDVPTADFVTKR